MTLLANGSSKDGSSQYYSYKLQRNDLTQQLLRPFTPDQLRENYCHNNSKFKILLNRRKYQYEVPKYSTHISTGPLQ